MRPADCRYAETHEWAKPTGKKEVLLGITDYAVSQLSDLVHLELPKEGEKVEQGTPFGEIESVKTVADLVSPVSGTITAVNKGLVESPEGISGDPFDEGWFIRIKMDDPKELDSLMSAEEYTEFIESAEEEDEEEDEDSDEDDFM
ncbi:MAG: glycine cleavage system protein GcvH [Planctomycetota bacterium]|jgi:glycine cleavage system H protein